MALNGEELLRQKQFEQEQYARPTIDQLTIARLEQQLQHAQNTIGYLDDYVDKQTNKLDLINGAINLYNKGERSAGITLDTIRGIMR